MTAYYNDVSPEFARLIRECRPAIVFGEQVASKAGREWLAGVRADLEGMGYAVGAADLCAAGTGQESRNHTDQMYAEVEFHFGSLIAEAFLEWLYDSGWAARLDYEPGAPHIRQRLYWVAYRNGQRFSRWAQQDIRQTTGQPTPRRRDAVRCGYARGLADGVLEGLEGRPRRERARQCTARQSMPWSNYTVIPFRDGKQRRVERQPVEVAHGLSGCLADSGLASHDIAACIEACESTFPLTQSHPGRTGLLKGYGNAIAAPLAAAFVAAVMEHIAVAGKLIREEGATC